METITGNAFRNTVKDRWMPGRGGFLAVLLLGAALTVPSVFCDTAAVAVAADDCLDCHAGQGEWYPAPDVSPYWSGSDTCRSGGHGDDGNFPGLACPQAGRSSTAFPTWTTSCSS